MFNTPILYIIFNRLDTVKRTFPKIKNQQPRELFIAADGPRPEKEGEAEKCKEVREWILANIDWNCKIHTLFREENLGCGINVSKAITWFFENVEQGIILEDDCLPDDSFFPYCEELLNRYKNNPKVMHIAGDNPLQKYKCKNNASYYFEKIERCWGWATWARAWKTFSYQIDDNYKRVLKENSLFKFKNEKERWIKILEDMRTPGIDIWDYQWTYKILEMDGLCINPSVNLVQNIGMNSGTHYLGNNDVSDGRPSFTLTFPLKHPKKLDFDYRAMKKIYGSHKKFSFRLILTPIKYVLKFFHLWEPLKKVLKKKD